MTPEKSDRSIVIFFHPLWCARIYWATQVVKIGIFSADRIQFLADRIQVTVCK